MANIFELNININSTEKSETQKALQETTSGGLNSNQDTNETPTPASNGKRVAAAVGVMAVEGVRQSATQIMNYEINKIGTIYGDQARQNKINNMMNAGNTLISMGTTIGAGAAIGGPVGAGVAAVLAVATEAINMYQRYEMYQEQQLDNTRNAQYAQERLGILSISRGR